MAFRERSFTRQCNILPNRESSFNPVPPDFSGHNPSSSQLYPYPVPIPTHSSPFVQSIPPNVHSAQLAHGLSYPDWPPTVKQNNTGSTTSQPQNHRRHSRFLQGNSGLDAPDWSKQHQAEIFLDSTGSSCGPSSTHTAPSYGIAYQPSSLFSWGGGEGSFSSSTPTRPQTHTYVSASSSSSSSHSGLPPLEGYRSFRPLFNAVEPSQPVYQSSLAPMFDLVAQSRLPTAYPPSTSSPTSSSRFSDFQLQTPFVSYDQQNMYDNLPATTESTSNFLHERQRTSTSPQARFGVKRKVESELLEPSKKTSSKRGRLPRDLPRRSYICEVCGCAFTRPSGLEAHERCHTGAKPYKCPIGNCRRPFSAFSNLKRHMIVHPGVNFDHVSVHELPFLVYDESHNPPLFWRERGAPVMDTSIDIALSYLRESNFGRY